MKKLLLMLSMFIAVAASAQVTFGVKAGASLYNITGSDNDAFTTNRKLKPGIVFGGLVDIPVSSVFSVQPSLLYSQEGNLQKDGDAKLIYKLNYLNLPVVLKYNHNSGFFGETGPQVGYLLSGKAKVKINDEDESTDVRDDFNSIAFAWTVGAGWKFKNNFAINARSQWGISKIVEDVNVMSSGFYASVYYTF